MLEHPRAGAMVSGGVSIEATVTSGVGLATVEWLIDGASVFSAAVSGTESGVSYFWSSGDHAPGTHTITLVVTDTRGNRTTGTLALNSI